MSAVVRRRFFTIFAASLSGLAIATASFSSSTSAWAQKPFAERNQKDDGGLEVVTPFSRSPLLIETWDGRKLPFVVEEATTPTLRSLGLMYRTKMSVDEGMLFVWDHDEPRTMWMKNTYLPLDMLFLNEHGIILHIEKNTTPESERLISHPDPARAVLEINGRVSDLLSIEVGDRVLHPSLGATDVDMARESRPTVEKN